MRTPAIVASLLVAAAVVPSHGAGAALGVAHAGATVAHLELVGLKDPAGTRGDEYGHAVAIAGNGSDLLVGAYDANSGRGVAYLYVLTRAGWPKAWTVRFTSPAGLGSYFGTSVALSTDGTTAYVGADLATVNGRKAAGAVYAYTELRGVWPSKPTRVLDDPGKGNLDDFGESLALAPDGGALLVGAPGHTVATTRDAGAAYVYSTTHGVLPAAPTATLLDPRPRASFFGYSVAVSDAAKGHAVAVVGAYATAVGTAQNVGAAYVFSESGRAFTLDAGGALGDPGKVDGDQFGTTVAVEGQGGLVLVGAPGETARGARSAGAVYTYVKLDAEWFRKQTVTAPSGGGAQLGDTCVAASGTTAIGGAPWAKVGGHPGAGTAFVYAGPGFTLTQAASISDPWGGNVAGPDSFGKACAESQDGDTAVIGAPDTPTANGLPGPGAAYVFDVAPHPSIRSVTPAHGSHLGGTAVTISGSALSGASVVRFGTEPATSVFVAASGTFLVATAPAHAAGSVRVAVTTPGGTASRAAAFTYT